jgi:hypothetical protein
VSLRAFHLLFIALSIVLSAFVAAWAVSRYRVGHETPYALASAASLLCAGGLAVYMAVFQRKTRRL